MKRSLALLLLAVSPLLAQAADASDSQLIERAVRDYIESQHTPDPARMERALDPKLAKRTYWRAADGSEFVMNTARSINWLSVASVACASSGDTANSRSCLLYTSDAADE